MVAGDALRRARAGRDAQLNLELPVLRVCAVLVAVLALPAVPEAAQRLNQADEYDFQMFRHSIAVRRNARVCERAVRSTVRRLVSSTQNGLRSIAQRHRMAEVSATLASAVVS